MTTWPTAARKTSGVIVLQRCRQILRHNFVVIEKGARIKLGHANHALYPFSSSTSKSLARSMSRGWRFVAAAWQQHSSMALCEVEPIARPDMNTYLTDATAQNLGVASDNTDYAALVEDGSAYASASYTLPPGEEHLGAGFESRRLKFAAG